MGLQQNYGDVLEKARQVGAQLTEVKEEQGKLVLKGTVPYAYERDVVWDQVKTHPNWQSETAIEFKVLHQEAYGVWTVQPGDTLSKIAKRVYGDPTLYPRIFEANRDQLKDPNRIDVGQKLRLPPKPVARA